MSTVTEIRDAIRKLPPHDAWKLAEELREHLDALWDKQFEQDVEAGRLDDMIAGAREGMRPARLGRWMKSSGTTEFWQRYRALPTPIREAARQTYRLWRGNPRAPKLPFKKVRDVYSIRIGATGYRAIAVDVPDGSGPR